MEESGSEGLEELVKAEAGQGGYFEGIDCACIVRLIHPGAFRLLMINI
jgi:hypothetical protein